MSAQVIYEISNPSDAITIAASDVRVAQAATLLLGRGKCGLDDEHGANALPIFIFGGADEWIAKHFPEELGAFIEAHREEIATCLESIVYGSIGDRKAIIAAVGADASKDALARFNEAKRTSMSDYASHAYGIAERLRELTCDGCSHLETSTRYCHALPAFLSASSLRCKMYRKGGRVMGEYERNLAPHEQAEKDRNDLSDLREQLVFERDRIREIQLEVGEARSIVKLAQLGEELRETLQGPSAVNIHAILGVACAKLEAIGRNKVGA